MTYDIITIGTATRDIFLQSPFFRPFKDSEHLAKKSFPTGEAECLPLGAKIEIEKPVWTSGGGAYNTAVTFSRQGLRVAAVVKIGDDEAGRIVLHDFKKESVEVFGVKDKKRATAHSVILLSPSGERTILNYRGASETLKAKEIPFSKLKSKWVYIVPGGIKLEILEAVINFFYQKKMLVAINLSKHLIQEKISGLSHILKKSAVVILNREEAAYLTGVRYKKEREIFEKLDRAISGIAVMTDGSRGAFVSDGRYLYESPVFETKEVIDLTGAGDAYGAGFVVGLIHQPTTLRPEIMKYAIRLATANAASVVECIGATEGILTRREFEKDHRWQRLDIKAKRL
ncbi:carbohydrate kinase family protein [Candidatus Wolfebacteria bacterium]|nr:carbohydrate kinase family protein [Candidatus Wolfebacteria bacterium]